MQSASILDENLLFQKEFKQQSQEETKSRFYKVSLFYGPLAGPGHVTYPTLNLRPDTL